MYEEILQWISMNKLFFSCSDTTKQKKLQIRAKYGC